jgi:hypothetical protein
MSYTPQGGATEGNAADDILMVNQGKTLIHQEDKQQICR